MDIRTILHGFLGGLTMGIFHSYITNMQINNHRLKIKQIQEEYEKQIKVSP
jgi:hypothetical protein